MDFSSLILQFGKISTTNEQVILPISYTQLYSVALGPISNNFNNTSSVYSETLTGFKINTTNANYKSYWVTVGY